MLHMQNSVRKQYPCISRNPDVSVSKRANWATYNAVACGSMLDVSQAAVAAGVGGAAPERSAGQLLQHAGSEGQGQLLQRRRP